MRSRSLFVLVLGGAGLVWTFVQRHADVPARADVAPPEGETSRAAAPQPAPDLRPAIQASIAVILAEQRHGHELAVYLDGLERTARAHGQVSALQVLPGLAAIEDAYPGDLERAPAFARRMEALQSELGQPTAGSNDPPPGVSAASLLQVLAATPPGAIRDKLVPQTLVAIARLPEAEQIEASHAMDRATAARRDESP